jgi:hypothetical protein
MSSNEAECVKAAFISVLSGVKEINNEHARENCVICTLLQIL